jgi:hypothetical protein
MARNLTREFPAKKSPASHESWRRVQAITPISVNFKSPTGLPLMIQSVFPLSVYMCVAGCSYTYVSYKRKHLGDHECKIDLGRVRGTLALSNLNQTREGITRHCHCEKSKWTPHLTNLPAGGRFIPIPTEGTRILRLELPHNGYVGPVPPTTGLGSLTGRASSAIQSRLMTESCDLEIWTK